MTERMAYMIMDSQKTKDGEYIPLIIKEGEAGFYLTDWKRGKDKRIAQKCCDDMNEKLGLTQKDVAELILMSLREEKPIRPAM